MVLDVIAAWVVPVVFADDPEALPLHAERTQLVEVLGRVVPDGFGVHDEDAGAGRVALALGAQMTEFPQSTGEKVCLLQPRTTHLQESVVEAGGRHADAVQGHGHLGNLQEEAGAGVQKRLPAPVDHGLDQGTDVVEVVVGDVLEASRQTKYRSPINPWCSRMPCTVPCTVQGLAGARRWEHALGQ